MINIMIIFSRNNFTRSLQVVKDLMKKQPVFRAHARYIVFKRWDVLEESDEQEVIIFFARPDVLSGFFPLAGFDVSEPNGVIAPFSSGCAAINRGMENHATIPHFIFFLYSRIFLHVPRHCDIF
jgi:Uncharacterised ArCR, COG2043